MKPYYECHITCVATPAAQDAIEKAVGWTYSAIDGDPDLGPGVKCYATRQLNTRLVFEDVTRIVAAAAQALRNAGIEVLREKVELVVYDKRRVRTSSPS